jgi:hypothetical protein
VSAFRKRDRPHRVDLVSSRFQEADAGRNLSRRRASEGTTGHKLSSSEPQSANLERLLFDLTGQRQDLREGSKLRPSKQESLLEHRHDLFDRVCEGFIEHRKMVCLVCRNERDIESRESDCRQGVEIRLHVGSIALGRA